MTNFRLIAAMLVAGLPSLSARAQTQAQQDRLDRIAQFVVTAPMCERLGMTLDPDLAAKAEVALAEESAGWRLDSATIQRLKNEAISRQGSMLQIDLDAAAAAAKSDAQMRNVRTTLLGYGRTCLSAARDPIFSRLVTLPPDYDLETEATRASDSMLESGGLASWQTPKIQARGDLMMLAGTCRSKIGSVRSDALVRDYGQSDDAKARNYYRKAFDEGLAEPSIISSAAGCDRAIARMKLKAR